LPSFTASIPCRDIPAWTMEAWKRSGWQT